MSNSTRQGGYDERLVVPLEASRRGAHRARVNPVLAALPLLAVVAVVALVIGVAYTLFFTRTNTSDDASAPSSSASVPAATTGSSSPVPSAASSSTSASPPPSASASTTPAAKVDKTLAYTVYNGSVARVPGLAAKATTGLKGAGFSAGTVQSSAPPVSRSRTTHIYYGSSSEKATAEAIKSALGVGIVKLNPSVAGQGIVVVVGDDYSA